MICKLACKIAMIKYNFRIPIYRCLNLFFYNSHSLKNYRVFKCKMILSKTSAVENSNKLTLPMNWYLNNLIKIFKIKNPASKNLNNLIFYNEALKNLICQFFIGYIFIHFWLSGFLSNRPLTKILVIHFVNQNAISPSVFRYFVKTFSLCKII